MRMAMIAMLLALCAGCATVAKWSTPGDRLWFPSKPMRVTPEGRFYAVRGTGKADFAILADETGALNILAYDDTGNGSWTRTYRMSDCDPATTPHLIVLLDSIPFDLARRRYESGEWRWFHPPVKVIPPFPSLSAIICNEILGGPPLPSSVEGYYDRSNNRHVNLWLDMFFKGYRYPWVRRTDFMLDDIGDVGLMYFSPSTWYAYELAATKKAVDRDTDRVTVVYIAGSAGLACAKGEAGINEAMDQIEQLCMQLLYERRGQIKISIVSDHGHNMMPTTSVDWEKIVRASGFHPTERIEDPARDVVLELSGVVTYFGVHTHRADAVAQALLNRPEVELAMYQQGDRVIVRSATESATIEKRGTKFRYTPMDGDVFGFRARLSKWQSDGTADDAGFVESAVWLAATAESKWPDAPKRVWDAFHGQVLNGADVLLTVKDGYAAGMPAFRNAIEMASTHGGLNALNSDAMLLTMIRPVKGPIRCGEVMGIIEPRYPHRSSSCAKR